MKKFYILRYAICVAFLFNSCKSKAQYAGYVSPELQEYVDEFVHEANSRGINGLWYVKKIDSIILKDNMPERFLGLYFRDKNIIYINNVYHFNRYITRKTVFHEIGHSAGLGHTHWMYRQLMSSQEFGGIKDEDGWQRELDQFFRKEKPQSK